MKRAMDLEQKTLFNELNQGKELAKQLMNHLHPSSSKEKRDVLVEKILSSYEKALSMLKTTSSGGDQYSKPNLESPHSLDHNMSPRSVICDQDSNHRDVFKKRKILPRWTEQVKVCLGTVPEGPVDDGYSWRKYGQKDILGATHPRAYYRCTHRHAQGCLATKQVQRTEEDSSLFEVTYKGRHTCSRASHLAQESASLIKQGLKEENDQFPLVHDEEKDPKKSQSTPSNNNIGARLEVKIEDSDTNEDGIFQSFSFPSTPIESEIVENNFFSDMVENNFAGSFSPPYISPARSESNKLSVSAWHMSCGFGLANSNVQTPDSDLTLDSVDFQELNFSLDSSEFFF